MARKEVAGAASHLAVGTPALVDEQQQSRIGTGRHIWGTRQSGLVDAVMVPHHVNAHHDLRLTAVSRLA